MEITMDEIVMKFSDMLRQKLGNHLKKIILFGSRARGDFTEDSDYDTLIIVDKKDRNIYESLSYIGAEITEKYCALIGSIVCDEEEWERKKYFPAGLNIIKEGIEI
jgi:predicted nucleotidyltransferase